MDNGKPVPSDLLRNILARPGMYVGDTDALLQVVWAFLSGFDCGYLSASQEDDRPLIPKSLYHFIQVELGLQGNEVGIVKAILQRKPDPCEGFEFLRDMIGRYYGCSFDREAWSEWKRETSP